MPTQTNGKAAVVAAALPTPKNISSTTNATPIVATTSAAHALKTGDVFVIEGATDAAANGRWLAGTVTGTTVVLTTYPGGANSVGAGGGAAAGTLISLGPGATVPLLSGSDAPSASGINAALLPLLSGIAWLFYTVQYAIRLRTGGSITGTESGSSLTARAGDIQLDGDFSLSTDVTITAIAGAAITGALGFASGLTITAIAGSAIVGALAFSTTGFVQLLGRKRMTRTRVVLTDASQNVDVSQGDRFLLKTTIGTPAAVRTFTLKSTGVVPTEGETLEFFATNVDAIAGVGPAQFTFVREDATEVAYMVAATSLTGNTCSILFEFVSGVWRMTRSSGESYDGVAAYGVLAGPGA